MSNWTFEKAAKWSHFHELACTVGREGLGCREWREIASLLPADSLVHVPEKDNYNTSRMIAHAADALERATGFRG